MKTFISAFAFGAALVAATPIRSAADLVARQDLTNPTFPRECEAQCVVWAKYSGLCPSDSNGGNRTATYECVCKSDYFTGARTCGACAPEFFANATSTSGFEEFTQTGLAACSSAGFPVTFAEATPSSPSGGQQTQQTTRTDGNTPDTNTPSATPDDAANTSGTKTLVPPTIRASATGLGGLTGAPISTSPAPAQPTGAASQLHVASGLLAMAFSAGIYVLL